MEKNLKLTNKNQTRIVCGNAGNMTSKNIGLIVLFISVIIGIIFTQGFVRDNGADTKEQPAENNPPGSPPLAQAAPEITPENISVSALTCTNTTSGEYEVDLRIKNQGTSTRTMIIYPLERIVELLPRQIKRVDILIPYENTILKLIVDDGEKFEVIVPPCVVRGGSGGNSGTEKVIMTGPTEPTATNPIPTQPTPTLPVATEPTPTNPTPTQPAPTTNPTTSIPEFQWIGLPVITVVLLMLFFRRQ
ncbi:Uncharacterised protein [uncultured archaeon]|nr:Uncharacterised protein [uncultured archaeon]